MHPFFFAIAAKSLADFAEVVVQLLIQMGAPGEKWLDLAPLEVALS